MMNAISRALARRDRERMEVRREAGAESGTDWATTLLFSCLHDKYGFGRNRFAAMNDMWAHLDEFQEGFIKDKVYVLTHNEVPIWEFMKCLNVECNIDYPALEAYEKQNGPVDIYHGNRGER